MTLPSSPTQKPGLFTAIAVMTLISGIVNMFWGFVASLGMMGHLIGVVCVPITILPTVLGIFEVIYAAKLLSAQPQPVKPAQLIAALEIAAVLFGNVFSMVVGILALVFYNDLAVKDYFAELNGVMPVPSAAASPAPIPPQPETAPMEPEPFQPEETPEEPKRTGNVADE
jgi:hypothetical protein